MKNSCYVLVCAVLLLFDNYSKSVAYGEDYASVTDAIKHYQGQIVNLADLDTEEKEFFGGRHPGRSPGIVKGDFNGDGKMDVALLTKSALLFFICTDRCKLIKSVDYGHFSGWQVIIPIKKGELVEEFGGFDEPHTPSVRLKNPGVHLLYLGKASIAFYWDKTLQNFNDITTGD